MSLPPNYNLLQYYKNDWYVETGIWKGDSIQLAIEAGFKHIIGIDNDPQCIEDCKTRFFNDVFGERVHLIQGESHIVLPDAIARIGGKITFLLDAHWQMLEGTQSGENPFPLLQELEAIRNHHRNDHTIIIDDMLIMQPDIVGYSNQDIKDALHRINPRYHFGHVSNPVINGIMVAHV